MAPLLASALAGLLVGATLLGRYALAGVIALVQALLILGLVRSSDVPAARTSGVVALVVGLVTTTLVAVGTPEGADALAPVAAAPGVGLVAMAAVQLARRDGRASLTASLTFGVTAAALAVTPVLWLTLESEPDGTGYLLLALAGAATATAFAVFPGPRALWVVGGTAAAAGVGLLVQASALQAVDADLGVLPTALTAGAAGLVSWTGLLLAPRFATGVRLGSADDTQRQDLIEEAQDEPTAHVTQHVTEVLLTATLPLVLAAPVVLTVCSRLVDSA